MFNYLLYRIGQFIALHLPLNLSYQLAVFISDLHYIFACQDRKAVKENLKVIFPDKSKREIYSIRIRMFHNFAKYLVDFFRFPKIDLDYIKRNVHLENIHYFDQALAQGKGVVVLTAHLGNWELGGAVTALLGYPFWVVALTHKHRRVNNFFTSQRESKKIKVIPLGRAVRQCLNALKENQMVALAGDRVFTGRGAVIDFFGKPTFLPEGPAAFSLKTGAPVVPAFMLRNNDDSFTLRIEKPIELNPGYTEKELLICYKAIIEDYIRKYPGQWYMFRRFWISEATT